MSENEWEPGDVAMVRVGGQWQQAMWTGGPQRDEAGWRTIYDATPSPDVEARRIMVIDPDDDEQVARLTTRLRGLPVGELVARRSINGDRVAEALKSFTEPRIPEPTGAWAVVQDHALHEWIKVPKHRRWMCASGAQTGDTARWHEIDVVGVLSEGVTP